MAEVVGMLRLSEILAGYVPVGRSTWWRWVKEKRAPQPVKISQRITVWRRSEVLAFVDDLLDEGRVL